MEPGRLQRILNWLTQSVPKAKPPPVKTQKSFSTLQPGQHLLSNGTIIIEGVKLPKGTRFEVVAVDSSGALLTPVDGPQIRVPLRQREWKPTFTRVRRPPKPRVRKPKGSPKP